MLFPGRPTPLIEVRTFEKAQQQRGLRGRNPSNASLQRRVYHLSGVLRCSRCGMPFRGRAANGRARPPTVYTLGKAWAALMRAGCYPEARACELRKETPIAHARATLDVRLKALETWMDVATEKELPFVTAEREERVIRPDNVVGIPGLGRVIFETEQAATLRLLKRITHSVQGKAAFFRSEAAEGFSSTVRVLINLPYGKAWRKTVET
jgi:hypothetical protein